MDNFKKPVRNYEALAWGALFIWWGVLELADFLPAGTGALGVGVILLGVNGIRRRNGVPTSSFSITLGILALALGILELAGGLLSLSFELPIFAILLIVLGVIFLIHELEPAR
jgi:hypothetical protein